MERHTRRCAARQRVPQHHEQTEHAPRMGHQRVSIHARQENSRTTQRQTPATGSRIGEQPRRMFSVGGQSALCRTIEITAKNAADATQRSWFVSTDPFFSDFSTVRSLRARKVKREVFDEKIACGTMVDI